MIINDASLVERAGIPREKGTDRSRFSRGQVDKYGWVDARSSLLPSELVAAYLLAQLEAQDVIQGLRAAVWNRYNHELAEWSANMGAQTPTVPQDRMQAPHVLSAHADTLEPKCIDCPSSVKGNTRAFAHYLPLHLSEMGRSLGGKTGQCPVTEDIADRLVRLPFYTGMSEIDQDRVIDAVLSFQGD